MLTTGSVVLAAGVLLAPLLAHGIPTVTVGYQIAFGASIVAFVGASYTFSLQARDLHRWNVVRVSQPVLSLIVIVVLWRIRMLTLDAALVVLAATMVVQLGWAYGCCRRVGLVPGRARTELFRPLAMYGAAQIAALTPAALNADLDQLVLSQTVPSADLGRYAIAVSLTMVPIPVVAAIGNVAFPRLASQHTVTSETRRLQRAAILVAAGLAAAMLFPLAGVAYWLVPLVFGSDYRGAVPLLWVLTPGALFLCCGQVVGRPAAGKESSWLCGMGAGAGRGGHGGLASRPAAGRRRVRRGHRLDDLLRHRSRPDAPPPAASTAVIPGEQDRGSRFHLSVLSQNRRSIDWRYVMPLLR